MYQYLWDAETGGLLLTSEISKFSKEPRPVYYRELDILGFGTHWSYPRDDNAPIMWAEANNYIYRGRRIASTKGGSLYTRPELVIIEEKPEPNGAPLVPVDVQKMCRRNADLMETLVQETIQKIYNTYMKYRDRIDVFYVAFSGGKDSVVTLDLVQRALPHDQFMVLFGDTQMEFPDTYELIEKVKQQCENEDISFLVARSEHTPDYTWREFGPPAQTMRWCCSVHKTSPQILLLRQITDNPAFRGMAFTGIRADESATRSQYDEISVGDKHKGQSSFHPILDWSSAEVFIYIYSNKLLLNETYKKGNSRAGCLVCPMATDKNFFFKEKAYGVKTSTDRRRTTTQYIDIIAETTSKEFAADHFRKEFLDGNGWKARRSGKELNFAADWCVEETEGDITTITLKRERTDWKEWIKTLGEISYEDDSRIVIMYKGDRFEIHRTVISGNQVFSIKALSKSKNELYFISALKIILRKAAYCIGCHVCQANCPFGYISMQNGTVHIDDRCIKCHKCHEVFHGCLVANSLRIPKGVTKMGSVDRYGNIGIEYEWVRDFFSKGDDFWENNELGTNKVKNMKSFLADADIVVSKKLTITEFGRLLARIGIESDIAWGLIVSNLVYTAEFNWWIMHTTTGEQYTPAQLIDKLQADVSSANSQNHIVTAYKNIFASNEIMGKNLGLGECELKPDSKNRVLISVYRGAWATPDPKVILYSLYKFAEACGDYYQFSLSTLMDDSIDRNGISPTRIFGLDRDTMIRLLNGLSGNYPDFISASFTLDLETITLNKDKASADVLSLF